METGRSTAAGSSGGLAVRGPTFEDKAAIAIAAFDETDVLVDAQEDARMPERRRNLAGTVASDLQRLHADGFGRRNLG